jgi:TonB family protein
MKNLTLLTFLLAGAMSELTAQSQDTIYYDSFWKETTASQASYYRVRSRQQDGWLVTDYYLTGKPQMKGGYADDSSHIRQGEYVWFDSSGKVSHRCIYVNNKLNGPETYYYSTGRVQMSGNEQDDEYEGEWTGYYPSGKISAKAKFANGKQISGDFYLENGSPNKSITEFHRNASFPNGVAGWARFLNKTLRYPDTAVDREIQGTVYVQFLVSKEGKVSDLRVVQSVDRFLDEEALRVMRRSPDWQPAIMAGIISESLIRQPVIFKMQRE